MELKGIVLVNKLNKTKIFECLLQELLLPQNRTLEEEYREALEEKMLHVLDIACDKSSYLVISKGKYIGDFIYDVAVEDTRDGSFLPVKKVDGFIIPANLSKMEELAYLTKLKMNEMKRKGMI